MNQSVHNRLVSFIWSIADDCLRDVYVRGKYRDVILPMVVLRRLDALLEPTKDAVMEELAFQRDEAGFTEWDEAGLRDASGYVFYNTSEWTLQRLHDTATNSQQILQANVEDYLNGFSPNVREIIDKFKLKSQIRHMASKDVLLDVLEKFTSPHINLTPFEREDPDGRKLTPLSNLGMGYVFEELKANKSKLSASEKNAILQAVSWYDETAEKVIKKTQKISGDKLEQLLYHLDCTLEQLPDYGYYPSGKSNEYIIYDSQSDLRDSESVPLSESIHDYFLREVKPHVNESWIDLDKTKIGYEISFNKYFYQHKPLRSIEEVSQEILALEKENEGLIMDILNL